MSEATLGGNNELINLLCQVSIFNFYNINMIMIKYLFLKSRFICVFLLRSLNFYSISIIKSIVSNCIINTVVFRYMLAAFF